MSSSKMPDGGYQPTYAGNYGLDGFDFSEEYGEGPATNHKIPTTNRTTGMAPVRSDSGMSHLPDGFVTGTRAAAHGDDVFAGADGTDLGDLSGMVREAGHLTDLTWLETAEQDPDRLPHHHNDAVIQGLVEAWGTNRRTDGVDIVPNVVVPPPARSQTALLPGDQFREIVASAMRKSAFGQPFENIVADVVAHLGGALSHEPMNPRMERLASTLRRVKAEHGIAGKVYLRDSAFPGLLSGKWDAEIKKRCASAHYWLTAPGSKLSAYNNYLGKKVVTSIPWGDALNHYRPALEASGKRLASGDPKTVLLNAFRQNKSGSQQKQYDGIGARSSVPARSGGTALDTSRESQRLASDLKVRGERETEGKVAAKFDRWVKAGMLTRDQADGLIGRDAPAIDRVRAGAALASKSPVAQYEGQGVGASAHSWSRKASSDGDSRPLLKYAAQKMNEGMAGRDLDMMLNSRFSQEYLKGASEQLVQLRRKHEGLAGHVYVAASAYASTSGTTGCEAGALMHRANQIKALLQMDRCGTCSANSGGSCQKYNKQLVTAAPVSNPEKYQRETIRLANADDSERTASMFTQAYDPGEFDLQNDNLDSFDYSNLPDNQTLHGILFEGMVLPEE